jgi:hypothetical protein
MKQGKKGRSADSIRTLHACVVSAERKHCHRVLTTCTFQMLTRSIHHHTLQHDLRTTQEKKRDWPLNSLRTLHSRASSSMQETHYHHSPTAFDFRMVDRRACPPCGKHNLQTIGNEKKNARRSVRLNPHLTIRHSLPYKKEYLHRVPPTARGVFSGSHTTSDTYTRCKRRVSACLPTQPP